MRRLLILAAAAAAVVVVVVVLAGSGSAQTGPRTIHVVSTTRSEFNVDNRPRRKISPGDVFGFADSVRADDGSTGRDVGQCTVINRTTALCHVQAVLPTGQLGFQFWINPRANSGSGEVTGGTGAYAGARGTFTFRDLGRRRTDVTITLLG